MSHLLLVEDELHLRDSLKEFLEAENFKVTTASTLEEARDSIQSSPDAVVLDWLLPDGQGIDLLKEWRNAANHTPVILLTAKTQLVDKVLGLEMGADDYLTKPFEPRELIARLRVQLRKPVFPPEKCLEQRGIQLNLRMKQVTFRQQKVEMTKMEFNLLSLFLQNPDQVFSREELLNQVWGYDRFPTTRTVDTHILQLRTKFEASFFETIRGMGYRFNGDPA